MAHGSMGEEGEMQAAMRVDGTERATPPERGSPVDMRKLAVLDPVFCTGIETIDNKHRRLVDRLENLSRAIEARCSKAIIEQFLVEFIDLAVGHFEDEETVMAEIGYPGLEEHRAEHEWLLIELERFTEEFTDLRTFPFREVLDFLWHWTIVHLVDCDSEYVPYLERWGQEPER